MKTLITILLMAFACAILITIGYLIALKMWAYLGILIGSLFVLGLVVAVTILLKFTLDLGGAFIKAFMR